LINVLPGGLTEQAVVGSLAAVTLGATFLAWTRRPWPQDEGGVRTGELGSRSALTRTEWWRLAAAGTVLVAIGVASFAIGDGKAAASTEFFLIDGGPQPAGTGGPPAPVLAGRDQVIALGLTNAGPAQRYSVQVRGPSGLLAQIKPFDVAAGDTWTGSVQFHLDVAGDDVQVDIVLRRAPDPAPYRSLRLVLDVVDPT
jgi:hypothetical protein